MLTVLFLLGAAVVTVYGVDAPRPARVTTRDLPQPSVEWAGTQTASAIGPGESGRTKYEVKYIQSRVVLHHAGGQQVTFVSEPMTATCKTCQFFVCRLYSLLCHFNNFIKTPTSKVETLLYRREIHGYRPSGQAVLLIRSG